MNVTYGPNFLESLKWEDPESSWVSKLVHLMRFPGWMLFSMTWKVRVTPAGRLIHALRGSVRRTSGKDSTGLLKYLNLWPTTCASDGQGGKETENCKKKTGKKLGTVAGLATNLASWPTPDASAMNLGDTTWEKRRESLKEKHGNNGFGLTLGMAVQLSS